MRYRPQDIIKFFKDWRDERVKKKISIFAICLFISIFIWIIVKLGKKYESEIYYPINYSGVQKNKAFIVEADSTLVLKVKTSGFRLIYLKYFKVPPPITIDLNQSLFKKGDDNEEDYYLPTNIIGSEVNSQLNKNTVLLGLKPDTIFLKLQKVNSKKVPVRANFSIDLAGEYRPYGGILINPDSITVSGKKEFLDTLDFVKTNKLLITDENKKNYSLTLTNEIVQNSLYLSEQMIQLELNIEKFTEDTKEVSVSIINLPDSVTMKVFPDKVLLKYLVAIKDYESTKNSNYKVIVDFNELSENKNFVKVKLEEYPEKVEIIKISPEKLEFILIKDD